MWSRAHAACQLARCVVAGCSPVCSWLCAGLVAQHMPASGPPHSRIRASQSSPHTPLAFHGAAAVQDTGTCALLRTQRHTVLACQAQQGFKAADLPGRMLTSLSCILLLADRVWNESMTGCWQSTTSCRSSCPGWEASHMLTRRVLEAQVCLAEL
jgi:hypothetical protein